MGMSSAESSPLPVPTTPAGRDGLERLLAHPKRAVLALDFDGTMAPIVTDPDQARAHPGVVPALVRLAPVLGSLAVITGRPAETAVRYSGFTQVTGLERLVVLGGYGVERWEAATGELTAPPPAPGVAAAHRELPEVIDEVLREAPEVLSGAAGTGDPTPAGTPAGDGAGVHSVWIEDKGRAVAVHTRRARNPQGALEALRPALSALASRHDLIVEPGRMVLELRPPGMDKGAALLAHAQEVGADTVLYGGDDLGDLAAFAAVDELRGRGGAGLLVCSGSSEVTELADRADLVVDGPAGVAALLGALADRLAPGGRD